MTTRDKDRKAQQSHESYLRNKDKVRKRGRERGRLMRMIANAIKEEPCMDCGVSYPPYVMDFDHRDPEQKLMEPTKVRNYSSVKVFIDELAKCDLVCSNCHRERTHRRRSEG